MNQSKEWHKERATGLGGSDIAAALGVSPWKTPLELWGEKTGLAPSTFDGNQYTYWGSALEPLIARKFMEDHTDMNLQVDFAAVSHDDHKWARANVDGIILDNNGAAVGIWEAKTASQTFAEVPVHYQLQVQHYMFVYDLGFAIISVLFGGNDYQEFRIERDPAYEKDIVPQLAEFWTKVESKMPALPIMEMGDFKVLAEVEDPYKGRDEVEGELASAIVAAQAYAEEAKANTDKAKKLKASIMLMMREQKITTAMLNGKAAATIVSVADGQTFDSRLFQKEHPDTYRDYLKTKKGYVSLRLAK